MAVKLIPSQGYIHDRAKILDSVIDHSLRTDSDAVPILRFFRYEERELHRKIKLSPLSAGINFPRPVKKATSRSGSYAVLYTCLPVDASTNTSVTRVNLDSILPTETETFNNLVLEFEQADFDIE